MTSQRFIQPLELGVFLDNLFKNLVQHLRDRVGTSNAAIMNEIRYSSAGVAVTQMPGHNYKQCAVAIGPRRTAPKEKKGKHRCHATDWAQGVES